MKIFDGYNLIGAGGRFGLALDQEDKEERLLRLLSTWRVRRRRTGPCLVVFDGHYGRLAEGPKSSTRGGITVEWAVGESADSVIVRKVRSSRNPRQVEVITSDAEVLRRVRHARGRTVRSEEFLSGLEDLLGEGEALEKPRDPTAGEVEEWLALFNEKETSE